MEMAKVLRTKSRVYRVLADAYLSPPESIVMAATLSSLQEAFHTLRLDFLAGELEAMRTYLENEKGGLELAVEYTRLFRGPVRAEVYPYESIYIDGEIMGGSTIDVLTLYESVGLALSPDFREPPDHVSAELEFMYYLCTRELDAWRRRDQQEAARLAFLRHSFLVDHLGRWLPPFAESISHHATTPFYLSLARITREFIDRENIAAQQESPKSAQAQGRRLRATARKP